MATLFSTPKLPPVAPPPPKPEIAPEDKAALFEAERTRQRTSRGRRSTLLTSGLGVRDQATTLKPKLGGY